MWTSQPSEPGCPFSSMFCTLGDASGTSMGKSVRGCGDPSPCTNLKSCFTGGFDLKKRSCNCCGGKGGDNHRSSPALTPTWESAHDELRALGFRVSKPAPWPARRVRGATTESLGKRGMNPSVPGKPGPWVTLATRGLALSDVACLGRHPDPSARADRGNEPSPTVTSPTVGTG